ncbi:hypothetical protein ABPG74_017087 [Tetrahymena malaccensis]
MEQKLFKSSIILLFLIGVFWIVFSSVIYYEDIQITDGYKLFQDILLMTIIFGSILIMWCVIGLNSNSKNMDAFYVTYNVGVLVFLLATIAALVTTIILANKVTDYKNDSDCTSESFLIEFAELNKKSFQTLCQSDCKCYYDDYSVIAIQQGMKNFTLSQSEAIRVQQCQVFESFDLDNKDSNSEILKTFEEASSCSGFCSKNSYFVFSDVNKHVPLSDCKDEIVSFVEKNNDRFIIASSIMTFFMIITFILSLLQLHQTQKVQDFQQKNVEQYIVNCS